MSASIHVGIDVANKSLAICILNADNTTEEFSTSNDRKGFREIIKRVSGPGPEVLVCLEATSTYHLQLCDALYGKPGIRIHCTEPRSSSDFRKAWCKRGKTDKLDARGLAHFLRAIPMPAWEPPRHAARKLRDFSRRAGQVQKDIAATRNRMHAARRGGACRELLRSYQRSIDNGKRELVGLRKQMCGIIKDDGSLLAGFKLLKTIKGFGEISSLTVLAELACLPAGLSKAKWICMAGMDPEAKDSGSISKPRHSSKRGNARIRRALFLPALVAIQHCSQVRAYYERLCAGGKKKIVAVFAVMRKLLLAIWGMFHTSTEWDPTKFTQGVHLTSK